MKKDLRNLIEKLEMELTRKDGEWAISVPAKNRPSQNEVKIIVSRKPEIIEELKAIKAEKLEQEKAEREKTPIKVRWEEGEILSGYAVESNYELALELGIAKMIEGWGFKVEKEIVEELGLEFTSEEVREYVKKINEKKLEQKEIEKKIETERLEELKAEAKKLGEKVEVSRRTVNCDGSVEECDTDLLIKYIDEFGTITQSRVHTH